MLLGVSGGGRLTLGDAVELTPLFATGDLAVPRYVPPWARDLRVLASVLAYSAFRISSARFLAQGSEAVIRPSASASFTARSAIWK